MGKWRAASLSIGRDAGYLSQYIRRGSPLWLSEADREALVALYRVDGSRLRPPLRKLSRHKSSGESPGERQQITAETLRKILEEPGILELFEVWIRIDSEQDKHLALRMLERLARTSEDLGVTKVA